MNSQRETDVQIVTEAFEWLVELEDPENDARSPYPTFSARLRGFAEWFLRSQRHQDAFIEAMAVSGMSRLLDPLRRIDVPALLSSPAGNVVNLRTAELARRPLAPGKPLPVRRLVWAACALLMILLLIPLLYQSLSASPVSYSTGIGERILAHLEDGSTIDLNTRSRVEVEMDKHRRRVTLLTGEAVFSVHHDASRPFQVVVGGVVVQDIGTKFAVYRHANGETTVLVIEGRVEIKTSGAHQSAGIEVSAGHQATLHTTENSAELRVEPVSQARLDRTLSWREGELYFNGQSLSEVVTEFNRYNRRQLRISDPEIAGLVVGGRFDAKDPTSFLATLQRVFNVRSEAASAGVEEIELKRGARQESLPSELGLECKGSAC